MAADMSYIKPSEIVKYFNPAKGDSKKTIQTLLSLNPEWDKTLNLTKLFQYCEKLTAAGILLELSSGTTLFERCYVAPQFDEAEEKYGTYDFIVNGFEGIIERFSPSVFPVVVEKKDGTYDLGTSFLVGNNHTLFTARHVVENMKSIKVLNSDGSALPIYSIYVSKNDDVDIAVMLISIPENQKITPLKVSTEAGILNEILSIGYPPIPGFDTLKIYDVSHVNSFVRLSKGRIVGSGHSYLDSQEFILFNARVKGGNSGGPIINDKGIVVGMLVQIPISSENSTKLDSLGYGIAVTGNSLLAALNYPSDGCKLNFTKVGEFEYSTL